MLFHRRPLVKSAHRRLQGRSGPDEAWLLCGPRAKQTPQEPTGPNEAGGLSPTRGPVAGARSPVSNNFKPEDPQA